MEVNPDLILLDVVMPDMDGFEVCRRLRTDPQLAEVPIILITSLNDRDARLALSRPATELILWELLVNARKFHPKHTPTVDVYVSCEIDRELTLTMAEDGSVEKRERVTQPTSVCLQVSDDGLMLSPEQLAHVFTPYFQGEKHFTGTVSGMGLGLSMVAALIWSAGGACKLYNRASGPGVVVELTLPLA